MARMELYLFFVTIMQQFSFKPKVKSNDINLKGSLGLVDEPDPFEAIVTLRK